MPTDIPGVMHEFSNHELHSGSKTGRVVTDRKQAIAIALAEQRKNSGGGGTPPSLRALHRIAAGG